jgi:hypothetical protein
MSSDMAPGWTRELLASEACQDCSGELYLDKNLDLDLEVWAFVHDATCRLYQASKVLERRAHIFRGHLVINDERR